MNAHDDSTARLEELRGRSRQVAATFAAEMERLTSEVTRQPASVTIRVNERGGVAGVEVDPAAFGRGAPTALAAATAAALASAGISALPDYSAEARRVMAMLEQGISAAEALGDVVDELTPAALEHYRFEEMTVEVDGRGAFSLVIEPGWFERSTAAEYAMAVEENVNAVLARREPSERNDHG